ncbi:MAG: hypothetical protein C6Y22_04100 [Hapalosiphonaceae cyanobacterium JJU2]|nr:MAG: hypothetical protein C6Y22_04100 [Hapalosiphonaceae cyanobacterium JJU2]
MSTYSKSTLTHLVVGLVTFAVVGTGVVSSAYAGKHQHPHQLARVLLVFQQQERILTTNLMIL